MATFSEDLQKLQELEQRYQQLTADYDRARAVYATLLERDPKDPDLATHYQQVEEKHASLQETYSQLEQLRRGISPTAKILKK